jgi:uncharacterized phage protein (TIGR02220 family)
MIGFIKLHRELIEKAIWKCSTPEQKVILITLLMLANFEPNQWEWEGKKYHCKPGQFVTSLQSIADHAGKGITVKKVRGALIKFEKYGFLASKSTNRNRLITIENWATYQGKKEKGASKQASQGQAEGNYIRSKESIYIIVEYLNSVTEKKFKPETKRTQSLIINRLEEGFTVDDFKKVIDNKSSQWLNDQKMIVYLRPETLFGKKFESYLNENISIIREKEIENWRGSDQSYEG